MATFINDYLIKLEEQWTEVDILIEQAKVSQDSNLELYNVICRSVSILVVAHMEGFIKGLAKNIVHDLNDNVTFEYLPKAVKKTYCKKYLGFDQAISKNYNGLLDEMCAEFSQYNDFKISYEPFLFDKNRNPKPDSIKSVLTRFGIADIFQNLNKSYFDGCFESRRKTINYLNKIKKVTSLSTLSFPYRASNSKFKLNKSKYNGARTLWQAYLDDLNSMRHKIVHGNSFDNLVSIEQLVDDKNKAHLLQLVITYCMCAAVVQSEV